LITISMKDLLEAGVHFGHQTKRWNPKMKDFIFGERNGIYIINLQKTMRLFKDAVDFITEQAMQGKRFLFVGTKRQAQEVVAEESKRCGQYFVNERWLGGLLTNFQTIQKSLKRLKELEDMKASGHYELVSKKEVAQLEKERMRLEKSLSGIYSMDRLPDIVFVVDSRNETIAVKEARKLGIPIVGIVDTNSDPDEVDFVIPGNDDAMRSIRLITSTIADAILAGGQFYQVQMAEQRAAQVEAAKQAAAAARAEGREEGGGERDAFGRKGSPRHGLKIKDRLRRPRPSGPPSVAPDNAPVEPAPEAAGEIRVPASMETSLPVEGLEAAPAPSPVQDAAEKEGALTV
jgi:small subunit ribosomal protein S2